jgi:hypothetical protein
MEQKLIIEGDKLIAKFMGWDTEFRGTVAGEVLCRVTKTPDGEDAWWERCDYHCLWNELMPVVEKIKTTTGLIQLTLSQEVQALLITPPEGNEAYECNYRDEVPIIITVWTAVVKYIQRHNTQNQQ